MEEVSYLYMSTVTWATTGSGWVRYSSWIEHNILFNTTKWINELAEFLKRKNLIEKEEKILIINVFTVINSNYTEEEQWE